MQIDVKLITLDVEGYLAAHEREARAQLPERFGDSTCQRVPESTLGDLAGEAEELDVIGILCHLLGKLRVRRGELAVKVR